MKQTLSITRNLLLPAALAAALTTTEAATLLANGVHADIGIAFDSMQTGSARWDLHIHKEEPLPDEEFAPDEAVFYLSEITATTSPGGAFASILGPMGTPNWIIPEAPSMDILRLGFASEEIMPGLFVGETLTIDLVSVSGPGEFGVFQDDGFGGPVVRFNTRDGITGADSFSFMTGSHAEHSFAFSAQGTYEVGLRVSGTLVAGNEFTQSDIATYTFQVVPEPSTWALMAGGAVALVCMMLRRRTA